MATWNTDAADYVLRADQTEYNKQKYEEERDFKRAHDAEKLAYDRQWQQDERDWQRQWQQDARTYNRNRQAALDAQQAQVHALRLQQLRDANALAQAKNQLFTQNLPNAQRLLTLKTQNEINKLQQGTVQNKFSGRSLSPYVETLLKFRAIGGDENALTDKEKDILLQKAGYAVGEDGASEYFDQLRNLTDKELNAEGLDPQFIPEYARQMRAAAVKEAEYNRKNASAIAKQARDEQYKTVSGFMTGLFNSAVAKGTIDPEKAKSKEIIEAATNIYNNAKNSGQDITPQQAFNMAAGIKDQLPTISEQAEKLYGAQYNDLDDADKKKLELMLTKFSAAKNSFDKKNYPKGSAEELKKLRELEEYWRQMANAAGFGNWFDTYSDVKSPIFERLQHADYAAVHDEMLAREKALAEKYPRYFAWAKNNPGVSIRNYENYLVSPDEYTYIAAGRDTQRTPPKYYLDFKNEMLKIQELRDHLRKLEGRIENNKNRFVD